MTEALQNALVNHSTYASRMRHCDRLSFKEIPMWPLGSGLGLGCAFFGKCGNLLDLKDVLKVVKVWEIILGMTPLPAV